MTEQQLESWLFKNIRITCTDGEILEGYAYYYADADEDEGEEVSITLADEKTLMRDVVVSISEIEKIEVI